MAKRPLWSGVIGFGLVQIPVGMHSAEEHSDDLSMTLLDARDHNPVGYKHYNKVTGKDVPKERRIKGYEVAKNEFVVLTDADFKAANVKATETIEIHSFVDAAEVPTLHYDRPYWLSPLKKGAKPYVLLREALEKTGKVGIATVVMRGRQHLCAVYAVDDVLGLQTLRYDDEVRPADELEIDAELGKVHLKPAEVEMAAKLVEGMEGPFDISEIHDTYKDDLLAVINERKKNPEHIPEPKKAPAPIDTGIDLMALLQESVSSRLSTSKAKPKAASKTKTTAKTEVEAEETEETETTETEAATKKKKATKTANAAHPAHTSKTASTKKKASRSPRASTKPKRTRAAFAADSKTR